MKPLDGLYRHGGVLVVWNEHGITITDTRRKRSVVARWDQIVGARPVGEDPGYVQLLIHGRDPAPHHLDDTYAFAVNSEHDSQRLVTTMSWHAAAPA